ncbi:MAG: dynamin family protein [Sulfuricellaceae bacterium]|jgi:GTP-binding protein EngB required for normal cell division
MDKPVQGAEAELSPNLGTLRQCLKVAEGLAGVPSRELHALKERADASVFNLVVVGEFKRGKSSVINALIGADILPVGVVPLTAIATILSYGEWLTVTVLFQNGERREVPPEALWDYATEKGNPRNEKGVAEVWITYPSDWLKSGVRLVDTPGIGSVYRHNTDVTYRFLPKADAVLFLLSVDQPVGQAEYDFLKKVGEYAGKIFFLLNKADLLAEDDLEESVAFSTRVIAEAMGRAVPIFPLSARLALEGQAAQSAELLERSRFPAFSAALSRFLMEEKGNALVVSVARNLLRLVSQARFTAELARQSLRTPVKELEQKIAAFEEKRKEIAQAKHDFAVLLESETRQLANRAVADDVEAFKARLTREIEAATEKKFAELRHLPSGELQEALQRFVIDEVRDAYDEWREKEDDKLAEAFHATCARFTAKIDETVDELYRFSSELFAIPFGAVRAESHWSVRSSFYYKFWSEPPSLRIIASSFVLGLPKFLGDRLILKEALNHARESADTQAGRLRYDFAQRLDKSMHDFKAAMLGRIDATLEGIETAVRRGAEIGAAGTREADIREGELSSSLQALDDLAGRLERLMEQGGATDAKG